MEYSKETIENKNFLKRFSHQQRFVKSSELLNEYKFEKNISMLDFGSGDGFFIKYLIEKKFSFDFSAYEPDPEEKQIDEMKKLFSVNKIKNVKIYNKFDLINEKYDVITCLETMEHFGKKDQERLLSQMLKLLKPNGVICISVPIEVYFSGFAKMIFRKLVGQSHENTNLKNIFNTLFGLPIVTPDTVHSLNTNNDMRYINTHVGFYYFDLINLIKSMNLKIETIKFSPFPKLKYFLNSQIFFKIKLKN